MSTQQNKWTPGPWLVEPDADGSGTHGYWQVSDKQDAVACNSGCFAGYKRPEELKANACLISASPDGFAFALSVESAIVDADLADSPVWGHILTECRAYMRKARGEA